MADMHSTELYAEGISNALTAACHTWDLHGWKLCRSLLSELSMLWASIGGLSGRETRLAARAARQTVHDASGRVAWVALDRKRARPWKEGCAPLVAVRV